MVITEKDAEGFPVAGSGPLSLDLLRQALRCRRRPFSGDMAPERAVFEGADDVCLKALIAVRTRQPTSDAVALAPSILQDKERERTLPRTSVVNDAKETGAHGAEVSGR
jgi:hypothetical protein